MSSRSVKALAGDVLPDEVADEQAQERLALHWRECDGCARVVLERLPTLLGERVDRALPRLARLLAGASRYPSFASRFGSV